METTSHFVYKYHSDDPQIPGCILQDMSRKESYSGGNHEDTV